MSIFNTKKQLSIGYSNYLNPCHYIVFAYYAFSSKNVTEAWSQITVFISETLYLARTKITLFGKDRIATMTLSMVSRETEVYQKYCQIGTKP